MHLDSSRDIGRLALCRCIIAAHQPLQLGEFTDHSGGQIRLGQHGGALGPLGVGANLRGNLGRQLDQPFDAGELGAQLGMEHRLFQLGQAMLERQRQVAIVEEHGIAQARTDDALIAGHDDGAAVGGDGIGGDDEVRRQLAGRIAQAEALLVGPDGRDDDLLGQGEEIGIECAHHDDRPLDQARHFFEQAFIGNDAQALGESQVLGIGADDVLAAVDVEHDLGAFQRLDIVVEPAHADRVGSEEAVSERGLPRLQFA